MIYPSPVTTSNRSWFLQTIFPSVRPDWYGFTNVPQRRRTPPQLRSAETHKVLSCMPLRPTAKRELKQGAMADTLPTIPQAQLRV